MIKYISLVFIVFTFISVTVQAELIDRGGGLIYDTNLDITILQDANYSYTSGIDDDGRMGWGNAMVWADSLNYYDSVRDILWKDWRLPSAYNLDGSGPIDEAYVTTSEVGQIYLAYLSDRGMFDNVQVSNVFGNAYWTSTPGSSPGSAFEYSFKNGWQEEVNGGHYFVWAVRDGDVAPPVVPEPLSSTLFIVGGSIMGIRRFWKK